VSVGVKQQPNQKSFIISVDPYSPVGAPSTGGHSCIFSDSRRTPAQTLRHLQGPDPPSSFNAEIKLLTVRTDLEDVGYGVLEEGKGFFFGI
jgi:hypothetical protein